MANLVRDIEQSFWCSKHIPHLTVRSTINSTQSYKAHHHTELSIGIIKSGKTSLVIGNNKKVILKPSDVILIEPEKVHACNPVEGEPRSYYMLYIDKKWCCKTLEDLYGYEVDDFVCDQALVEEASNKNIYELIEALLSESSEEIASRIDSEIFKLLVTYCSPAISSKSDNEIALSVKYLLLEDMTNPPSLDTIALALGRSKETLIRSFKSRFNITPKSFLNNHRIETAKVLLRQGMDIVDVASEVGYSDQSQLHRAFVSYTASTPRQYQIGTSIFDNKS